MFYIVHLTSWVNGQHQYTEPYDYGVSTEVFSAETYARSVDYLIPLEDEELEFSISFYANDADPMFDEPIYSDEWRYSNEE